MWASSLTMLLRLCIVCSETSWSNSNDQSWLPGQSPEQASHRTIWSLLWKLTVTQRAMWEYDKSLPTQFQSARKTPLKVWKMSTDTVSSWIRWRGSGKMGSGLLAACTVFRYSSIKEPAGGIPINVCAHIHCVCIIKSPQPAGNDLFTGYRRSSKCTGWQLNWVRRCDTAWETKRLKFTHPNLCGPNQHSSYSSISLCFIGTSSACSPISIKVTSLCRPQDGQWEGNSILLNPLLSQSEVIIRLQYSGWSFLKIEYMKTPGAVCL